MLMTESAFYNQVESETSIIERKSKMLTPIYAELNKFISQIEQVSLKENS